MHKYILVLNENNKIKFVTCMKVSIYRFFFLNSRLNAIYSGYFHIVFKKFGYDACYIKK
jgi:hypothetical protein